MAMTVARRRKVVTVLRWLSVTDFSSYGGGAIWEAHLGGFTARSGGVGRAQQRDRELDLRWCRNLAPMDGWMEPRLAQTVVVTAYLRQLGVLRAREAV
jgi:hypothetical protein